MKVDIINTPWDCDNIVFLPGDWEISRASEEGKYRYTVSGIVSRNIATAADLVKWKMAKFLSLELLLPWENDGIAFAPDTDILRDFVKSTNKEKYYLLHDGGSATKLLRVNKYYLVKEKYAVPTDELKQSIANKKVKNKKYNRSCEPWPEDDIFILDTVGDETITRGASPGQYRLITPSIVKSRSANALVSDGRAIPGFDVRLEELSSSESASMQEYYEATRGFWLANIGTVPAFSEIARIWSALQYNPNGAIGKELLSELNQMIDLCKTFGDRFADFSDRANLLDNVIKSVQPKVIDLENDYNVCQAFQSYTVFSDLEDASKTLEKFIQGRNEVGVAYKEMLIALITLEEKLTFIKLDISRIRGVRAFPHNVLPQEYVNCLQAKEDELAAVIRELNDFSPYDLRLAYLSATVELIRSAIEQMDVSSIKRHVEKTMARKRELERLRGEISRDEKYNKKPGLLAKPNKEDGIKYTTGVQIKNISADKYVVNYPAGRVDVSALELIYLGLAKRV